MKNIWRITGIALAVVLFFALTVFQSPGAAQSRQQATATPTAEDAIDEDVLTTPTPQVGLPTPLPPAPGDGGSDVGFTRTVSVSGTGTISSQPDAAVVVIGVQTEADTASEALSNNSTQMNDLLTALQGAGIAGDDVKTVAINLYPRYSNVRQPEEGVTNQQVEAYIASNLVEISVADLEDLGDVLDTAVQAGGNRIDHIRFEITDQEQLLDQAREAALNDARRKAEQLATLTGSQLGQVVSIAEGVYNPPIFFGRGGFDMAQEAQAASVPVQPGTQDVVLTVQVTWSLVGSENAQNTTP